MINYQDRGSDRPIDYDEVLERVGGDTTFLEELLNIYSVEFQERQRQVEQALQTADFAVIQEIGHSIKGASANLSLPTLRRAAASLELAGRERNIERARQALGLLVTEYQVLSDYLKQNPPGGQGL